MASCIILSEIYREILSRMKSYLIKMLKECSGRSCEYMKEDHSKWKGKSLSNFSTLARLKIFVYWGYLTNL